MSRKYTEAEAIASVDRLTIVQLRSFVEAEVITPTQTDTGPVFRQVDLARIELLCELSEDFDLHLDALGIVISLIDQLHGVRGSLRAVLDAVEREPENVRLRIQKAIREKAAIVDQ
ncbi:chaperone modulator CbpM [Salipiger sp. 1_MG-2023]|uniref:chaperone modulator CbpM n=1 Tax=Salipiger sp. 1_MG-2023 TaxID=3062665 RepID=UPI0026E33C87|nr:chaperone modulator CbpM [Salipiger sp. 1_MG-2023]MDO6586549.1 chaperone modulator CbpM [Salipiger sp. 1_MG-2023]